MPDNPTVSDVVCFSYQNHRGEVEVRFVRPIRIWFGSTAWHPHAGWLLEAFDVMKQATRDFALEGVRGRWYPAIRLGSDDKVLGWAAANPATDEPHPSGNHPDPAIRACARLLWEFPDLDQMITDGTRPERAREVLRLAREAVKDTVKLPRE